MAMLGLLLPQLSTSEADIFDQWTKSLSPILTISIRSLKNDASRHVHLTDDEEEDEDECMAAMSFRQKPCPRAATHSMESPDERFSFKALPSQCSSTASSPSSVTPPPSSSSFPPLPFSSPSRSSCFELPPPRPIPPSPSASSPTSPSPPSYTRPSSSPASTSATSSFSSCSKTRNPQTVCTSEPSSPLPVSWGGESSMSELWQLNAQLMALPCPVKACGEEAEIQDDYNENYEGDRGLEKEMREEEDEELKDRKVDLEEQKTYCGNDEKQWEKNDQNEDMLQWPTHNVQVGGEERVVLGGIVEHFPKLVITDQILSSSDPYPSSSPVHIGMKEEYILLEGEARQSTSTDCPDWSSDRLCAVPRWCSRRRVEGGGVGRRREGGRWESMLEEKRGLLVEEENCARAEVA